MFSVGASTGGYRRWLSAVPPGKSRGRLRQKLTPASTSRTPSSTFSGVSRLIRPSSSSSPQSPQVDPSGRCFHRCVTCSSPSGRSTRRPAVCVACTDRLVYTPRRRVPRARPLGHRDLAPQRRKVTTMTTNQLVVSADGHILEPTDLFTTRLPKHLRDRGVWEDDFEIEPLVEGGARIFRRLHTPGFEGWTISRYRQTSGRMPEGDPDIIIEDLTLDGVDVGGMRPRSGDG